MVFTDIFDVLFYVVSKYKKGKKICTSLETKPDEEVFPVFNRQVRKTVEIQTKCLILYPSKI